MAQTVLGNGIRLTIQALQTLNATVTSATLNGVTYSIKRWPGLDLTKNTYPPSLETAFLPCTIIFPLEGETVTFGSWKQTVRTFDARTYIDPLNQGKFDDPIQAGMLLLQRYLELYENLINSDDGDNSVLDYGATSEYRISMLPFQSNPITDSGVVANMKYVSEEDDYFGFSIKVRMLLEWPINC